MSSTPAPLKIRRENTLGVIRDPHLSSHSTNLTSRLAARQLFGVPLCRKDTIHLQIFMPSPGFEPRPYSTLTITVSIPDHCTEKSEA
ncbi:hypothetical protein TNCV_4118531 [Trichonephila clavipes]|nr:hypothetical protein TNCV_4118531 [Trichonephila clavipes]